jgi:hypothetical protein
MALPTVLNYRHIPVMNVYSGSPEISGRLKSLTVLNSRAAPQFNRSGCKYRIYLPVMGSVCAALKCSKAP